MEREELRLKKIFHEFISFLNDFLKKSCIFGFNNKTFAKYA